MKYKRGKNYIYIYIHMSTQTTENAIIWENFTNTLHKIKV